LLQQRAAVGKHQIGRRGTEGDEVDLGRRDPGSFERAPCSVLREVDRGLAVGRDVPALDAGARAVVSTILSSS
jgi:hypothetical protein